LAPDKHHQSGGICVDATLFKPLPTYQPMTVAEIAQ
jgi:hypothetical protein